jgi:hypothetical protein
MGECTFSSTILDLVTRWRWVVSFAPWPLYHLGKSPRYTLDRRLGGPQSRSGWCRVKRNLLPLPEIEHLPSSPYPVAVATDLALLIEQRFVYLSICGCTALYWTLATCSVSWSFTQSVGLLGRGISPLQGRYLHTEQPKHRINAHRHPCLKWDSNPRSRCFSGRRQYVP